MKSKLQSMKGKSSLILNHFLLPMGMRDCFGRDFLISYSMPLGLQDSERMRSLKLEDMSRIQKMCTMSKTTASDLIYSMPINYSVPFNDCIAISNLKVRALVLP